MAVLGLWHFADDVTNKDIFRLFRFSSTDPGSQHSWVILFLFRNEIRRNPYLEALMSLLAFEVGKLCQKFDIINSARD